MSISKIIHQIWVGDNPIPGNLSSASKSWKIVNPTYLYLLHRDKEVNSEINQPDEDLLTD
jgi:mannosyltransferase OCH1-like enzyme